MRHSSIFLVYRELRYVAMHELADSDLASADSMHTVVPVVNDDAVRRSQVVFLAPDLVLMLWPWREMSARGFHVRLVVPCTPVRGSFQHRCNATHVLDQHRSLVASSCESLQAVRKKNRELRDVLNTVHWSSLQAFEAHGKTYALPLKHAGVSLTLPTTERLRYLAGFFDGDGCVLPEPGLSGCRLVVNQTINQAAVLILFLEAFGGNISVEHHGVGLHQPILRWRVFGCNAARAARLLVPFSITKGQQLLLAASWPQGRFERHQCKEKLACLKQYDSAVAAHCSWEYIAGFFDAEGHVRACGQAQLSLHVFQKFGTVLACLKDSLAQGMRIDARMYMYSYGCCLSMTRTSQCKQVLRALLPAGLLCKAEQANWAISMTRENASQVRAALRMHVGNQGFGKRLDEDGLRRSVKIVSARREAARLKCRGELDKVEVKLQEIECLKNEHQLLNACRENQLLHQYMRELRRCESMLG